jgi:hypothetical protein
VENVPAAQMLQRRLVDRLASFVIYVPTGQELLVAHEFKFGTIANKPLGHSMQFRSELVVPVIETNELTGQSVHGVQDNESAEIENVFAWHGKQT